MGNIEARAVLTFFFLVAAVQSSAQDGLIAGRMSCVVTNSQFVASPKMQLGDLAKRSDGFSTETSLIFEYTLDEFDSIEVIFREENDEAALFEKPFFIQNFKGLTPFVGLAEFESNYRELTFGHSRINYSGNDQLYLKRCSTNDWSGHYVKTYLAGHFTQVAMLNCHAEIDAVDEVLARLKVVH